jgi:hypothetical protein
MHTEHLQNVRVGRVLAGWLVAIAVTSLVLLAFAGAGWLDPDGRNGGELIGIFAVAVGFFAGGWFAGSRALEAPILHGIAIGLTSLVAWLLINTVLNLAFPAMMIWDALSVTLTLVVLLLQITVAIAGALIGYNMALRGRISLEE